jgi:hypothetical protein
MEQGLLPAFADEATEAQKSWVLRLP